MAALTTTNLENVVPVRVDLTQDAALWCNVDYFQQIDLVLESTGNPWDIDQGGSVVLTWKVELRESPSSTTIISTGEVVDADSDFTNGEVMVSFPGSELSSSWANREVVWALAVQAAGSTKYIGIAHGKAQINGFVANPNAS